MSQNEMNATTTADNLLLLRADKENAVWDEKRGLLMLHCDCLGYIAMKHKETGLAVDKANLHCFDFGYEGQMVDALVRLGFVERIGHGVVPTARGMRWAARYAAPKKKPSR